MYIQELIAFFLTSSMTIFTLVFKKKLFVNIKIKAHYELNRVLELVFILYWYKPCH